MLQLFAVYVLNGGSNEAAFTNGLIGARPKLATLFKQFISESKLLLQFISQDFKKLLRPLLAAYGINSFMPMLSCNLARSSDAASALHAAVCAVVAKVGGNNRLPNRNKVGRCKLPKFSPWDKLRYTEVLAQRATRYLDVGFSGCELQSRISLGFADARAQVNKPASFPLHCPLCGTIREAARGSEFLVS